MVGRTIGSYQLRRELRAHRLGVLYEARSQPGEQPAEVLLMPSGDVDPGAYVKRLAALKNPLIEPAADHGRDGDVAYLVRPPIQGRVASVLAPEQAGDGRIYATVINLLRWMSRAHEKGFVLGPMHTRDVELTPDAWSYKMPFDGVHQREVTGTGLRLWFAGLEPGSVADDARFVGHLIALLANGRYESSGELFGGHSRVAFPRPLESWNEHVNALFSGERGLEDLETCLRPSSP